MSQLQTYIDPISTREILNSLSLAIDETRLLREIENKKRCLNSENEKNLPAERDEYLRNEIVKLQVQLNFIRDRSRQI